MEVAVVVMVVGFQGEEAVGLMIEEMTDFQEGEVVVETDGEDVSFSRTIPGVMVKFSHAEGACIICDNEEKYHS